MAVLFPAFYARVTEWLFAREAARELASFNDRELADLGLRRCDIDRLAWRR